MDGLAEFRRATGYTNRDLERMTGYSRHGLNKGIKKIREPLQVKMKLALDRVVDQRIAEETAAYEARIMELKQLKNSLRYDYEEPKEADCKVLQFAKGGINQ